MCIQWEIMCVYVCVSVLYVPISCPKTKWGEHFLFFWFHLSPHLDEKTQQRRLSKVLEKAVDYGVFLCLYVCRAVVCLFVLCVCVLEPVARDCASTCVPVCECFFAFFFVHKARSLFFLPVGLQLPKRKREKKEQKDKKHACTCYYAGEDRFIFIWWYGVLLIYVYTYKYTQNCLFHSSCPFESSTHYTLHTQTWWQTVNSISTVCVCVCLSVTYVCLCVFSLPPFFRFLGHGIGERSV